MAQIITFQKQDKADSKNCQHGRITWHCYYYHIAADHSDYFGRMAEVSYSDSSERSFHCLRASYELLV